MRIQIEQERVVTVPMQTRGRLNIRQQLKDMGIEAEAGDKIEIAVLDLRTVDTDD